MNQWPDLVGKYLEECIYLSIMQVDEIVDQSQLEKTSFFKNGRKVGKYIGEMVNLILITSESPGKHYIIVLCY